MATGILPVTTISIALFDSPKSPVREGPITSAGLTTANSKGSLFSLIKSQAAFSAKVLLLEYEFIL
jgi:hypothetical protein